MIPPLAALAPAASAQTTGQTQAKSKKPANARPARRRKRLRKCAAEWKEAKAAGKIETGMKWPKFWSACNRRLKSAS